MHTARIFSVVNSMHCGQWIAYRVTGYSLWSMDSYSMHTARIFSVVNSMHCGQWIAYRVTGYSLWSMDSYSMTVGVLIILIIL